MSQFSRAHGRILPAVILGLLLCAVLALTALTALAANVADDPLPDPPLPVTLTKADQRDPLPAQDLIRYTITITNTGVDALSDVQITDTIPGGTYFVSADEGGSGTLIVTWNVPSLAPGAGKELHLTLGSFSTTRGIITNYVAASAPGYSSVSVAETTVVTAQTPTATATATATPTATPTQTPGPLTISGHVYDALHPGTGIGGATVALLTSLPRTFSTTTEEGGAYSLTVPAPDADLVTGLQVTAAGYADSYQAVTPAQLRTLPVRDILLQPVTPTVTLTPTETATVTPHSVLLPIILRNAISP